MNNNEEMEIDLLRLTQALWKRAWAILLAALGAAGIAMGFTALFITPKYEAEALMYVNSSAISVGSTKLSISASELSAAQSLVETYIVIMNTRTTLNEVIAETGVGYTYEELQEMISAQSVNGTEVFSIAVTSTSPQEASTLANAIAQILPEKISSIVEGSSVRIVDYAVTPDKPASPSLPKNGVIGFALGFILMCSIFVVRELLDDQIHDSDYLTQTYEIPVLAVIPDLMSTGSSNDYYRSVEQQASKRGNEP